MVGEGRQIEEGRREIGGERRRRTRRRTEKKRFGGEFEVVVGVGRDETPTKVEVRVFDRRRS